MADTFIKYRYFLTDLVSNKILAEVPFTGVSYERALKSAGSFSGNVPISKETLDLDLYNITMPGKTGLYVTRNGVCVWGGIIWSRDYNVVSKELSVSASEFTSYLHHRRMWKSWMRNYPNITVTRWNGDKLKVVINDGNRITIDDGATVELIFNEYRAFDYRGHYKVVGNYYNASYFYVQDIPEEAFTGKPIAFNGNYRASESRKTIKKTLKITSRTTTKGKKSVVINTSKPHGLVPGDVINISGMDVGIGLTDYSSTTGDSSPLFLQKATIVSDSKAYGMSGTKYKRTYSVRAGSDGAVVDLFKVTINPSDPTDATLSIRLKFGSYGSALQEFGSTDPIWYSGGKYRYFAEKDGYRPGQNISVSGLSNVFPTYDDTAVYTITSIVDYISYSGPSGQVTATHQAAIDIKLPNDRTWSYSPAGTWVSATYTPEGGTLTYPLVYRSGFGISEGQKFKLSAFEAEGPGHYWDLDDNPMTTPPGLYTSWTALFDQDLNGKTVKVTNVETSGFLVTFKFDIILSSRPAYDLSGFIDLDREVHYSTVTKNTSADELNISNAVVASVTGPKSFIVNSSQESSVTKTVKQKQAIAVWTAQYAGSMNANTDIYDYVRNMLGHVFSDFSEIPYYNSYLGKNIASGIRKISYDENTSIVRAETGFIDSPVYKQILKDSRSIVSASIDSNLAKLVIDNTSFTLTSITNPTSSTVRYVFDNTGLDAIEVGDRIAVTGVTSPDDYNVEEAIVIAATTTSVTINSTATGAETLGATPRVHKYIPYYAGDEVTISGVDTDLSLGKRKVLDITTKIEEIINYKTISFTVAEEETVSSTNITAGSIVSLPYARLTLPTPYNQFYNDPDGGLTDVGKEIQIYGLDSNINGVYNIKRIAQDKSWFEYHIPKDLVTYDKVKLSRDEVTVIFGAHGLIEGSSARVSGLADYNYDGLFTVSNVPNSVTFEYEKTFPNIVVAEYTSKRTSDGLNTSVILKISEPPNNIDIRKGTNIYIKNVPIISDGIYTIKQYYDPTKSTVKYPDKLDTSKYYVEIQISGTSIQLSKPTTIDQPDRLQGDALSITSANYTINKKGVGVVTYTLSSTHGYSASDVGKYVYVSNVGAEFTQKSGTANAYSSLVTSIVSLPASNKIAVSQDGLWRYHYGTRIAVAKTAISPTSVSGGTIQKYVKPSVTVPITNPSYIRIANLQSYTSDVNGTSARKHYINGKTYDKDTNQVAIYTATSHGFSANESVTVDGVDDPGTNEGIFDGLHRITSVGKDSLGYYFTYQGDGSFKKDIGLFSELDKKATTLIRKRLVADTANNEVAYAVVEPSVFGASYGPFSKNSDIGIKFSTYDYAGVYNRGEDYRGHEMTVVADALDKFADKYIVKPGGSTLIRNVMGFEYRIDCDYDKVTNSFTRTFVFVPITFTDPPGLGETLPISKYKADKLIFEYPGNISDITLQESAEEAATRFWMVGSDGGTGTDGAAKSYVGKSNLDLLSKGWPLLEQVETNDQLNFMDDIENYADRYLVEAKPPMGIFDVTVNGSYDPSVSSYKPGEWCTIVIDDDFVKQRLASDFEPRNDVILRKIISYSVDVPDGNAYPESVKLTLIPEWEVDKQGGK